MATQHDSGANLREHSTPLFARVGLTDSLELRLGTKGRIASTSANVTTRGWTDASVGLRLQTQELDDKTGVAGRAWQLELGLPTGTNAFHAPSVSTALKFTVEWALPEDFSLGVMPGLIYQRNGANEWFTAPSFAVTLGKNWTPAFRTVVELAAPQITSNSNGGNVASVNLGATYRLTRAIAFTPEPEGPRVILCNR